MADLRDSRETTFRAFRWPNEMDAMVERWRMSDKKLRGHERPWSEMIRRSLWEFIHRHKPGELFDGDEGYTEEHREGETGS